MTRTEEARNAYIFTYLRIQKSDNEHDQMRFALDWFRTYGEEAYEDMKKEVASNGQAFDRTRQT